MKCPVCKNMMIVVEHEHIELDYCPDCAGVWFDAGELDLLFDLRIMKKSNYFLFLILGSSEKLWIFILRKV